MMKKRFAIIRRDSPNDYSASTSSGVIGTFSALLTDLGPMAKNVEDFLQCSGGNETEYELEEDGCFHIYYSEGSFPEIVVPYYQFINVVKQWYELQKTKPLTIILTQVGNTFNLEEFNEVVMQNHFVFKRTNSGSYNSLRGHPPLLASFFSFIMDLNRSTPSHRIKKNIEHNNDMKNSEILIQSKEDDVIITELTTKLRRNILMPKQEFFKILDQWNELSKINYSYISIINSSEGTFNLGGSFDEHSNDLDYKYYINDIEHKLGWR